MVETIWEGDVKEYSRAFDLICIVDQIHDYAVNHHRPFVMNHLQAWHARHQKTLEPIKKAIREIDAATAYMDVAYEDSETDIFDSDDSDNSSYDFDELAESFGIGPNKPAEWLRLKEQSKMLDKRWQTRRESVIEAFLKVHTRQNRQENHKRHDREADLVKLQ